MWQGIRWQKMKWGGKWWHEVARDGGRMANGWMSSFHWPLVMSNEMQGAGRHFIRVFGDFRRVIRTSEGRFEKIRLWAILLVQKTYDLELRWRRYKCLKLRCYSGTYCHSFAYTRSSRRATGDREVSLERGFQGLHTARKNRGIWSLEEGVMWSWTGDKYFLLL
jgi:hypothetical protein